MPRQSLKKRTDNRFRAKYHDMYFYGKTQAQANKKREEYKQQEASGIRKEQMGVTFADYACRWIQVYKANCGNKTYNSYALYINRASSMIGQMRMADIKQTDMVSVYNKFCGSSETQIRKFTMTMNAIFKAAVADGVCTSNPCQTIKRPSGTQGTHRVLEPWEQDTVVKFAHRHPFGLAAMVMLFAGLRRGEMLYLDIDRDVDFRKSVIHVRGAIHFDSNKAITGSTKTYCGVRDVPLMLPLAAALKGEHGLVLKGVNNSYASETVFREKFASYIKAVECDLNGVSQKRWYGKTVEWQERLSHGEVLPDWKEFNVRTHDFRHTYCTNLYNAGVDIKTAQRWMGHADETMIMKIYAHLTAQKEADSVQKLNAYLSNGGQNGGQTVFEKPAMSVVSSL